MDSKDIKDSPIEQSKLGSKLQPNFLHMRAIANTLVDLCEKKNKEYGNSWSKRGGAGAYLTMCRKLDRLEAQLEERGLNIFDVTQDVNSTESLDETIKDAINYLLLIQDTRDQIRDQIKRELTTSKTFIVPIGGDFSVHANLGVSVADFKAHVLDNSLDATATDGGKTPLQMKVGHMYGMEVISNSSVVPENKPVSELSIKDVSTLQLMDGTTINLPKDTDRQ